MNPSTAFPETGTIPWTRRAQLVFVVGSPRSGTTWLQAMLASHPSVATGPETHFFKAIEGVEATFAKVLPRQVGLRQYLSEGEFYETLAEMFHQVASKVSEPYGPTPVFLEKTPEHCLHARLILRCLPRARFIHLLRDGRHVVSSLVRAHREWADAKNPYRSVTIASQVWQQCVSAARGIPALLDDPDDYTELRYEDLKGSPVEHMEKLFDWMGLPADPATVRSIVDENRLEAVKQKRGFDTIVPPVGTGVETRRAEPECFFGRGATEAKATGLTRLEQHQFHRVCGPLLREMGYCDELPKVPAWAVVLASWRLRSLLGLSQV
jgi:hypothetical protein